MLNRPRCRDWSPLATQQLRLRNLIQISGHNIAASPKSSIYFTLHQTTMSSPFFTSDHLESFKNAIWNEINCQSIQKSTSQFICVRVWQHQRPEEADATRANSSTEGDSKADEALKQNEIKSAAKPIDKMLFVWGVYLSGLVPITKRSDIKLRDNALVFYMHGGFFTSPDYLLPESIPKQYNYFHQERQREKYRRPDGTSPIYFKTNTKNCDSFNSIRNSLNDLSVNDRKNDLLATSPKAFNSELTKQSIANIHEGFSQQRELAKCSASISKLCHHGDGCECVLVDPNALKIRYIEKEFFKLEIRRSYNVKKLLQLQEKQRIYRNRTISSKELTDKICMRSAFCLNLKLIANKGMLYRPRGNPSLGRTLDRLLCTQPEQPKPEDLLKAQELRRRIETAKFRCKILSMERDRHKVNLRTLQTKCNALSDENIDKESWLMASYRELSRNRDLAAEQSVVNARQRELYERVKELIAHRQKQLLYQLKDIYPIEFEGVIQRIYKINGIYLPNSNAYMDTANTQLGLVTVANINAALGYVAHIVLLCSSILKIPLRNKIIYHGSASRIRDDIKDLSEYDREFPLFCRSIPPADSLLYGVFLLNQNIAQIRFMLSMRSYRQDIRATLPNLLEILNAAETCAKNISETAPPRIALNVDPQEIPSSAASETSIDNIVPVPIDKTLSASIENVNGGTFTRLRSVSGSYSDENVATRQGGLVIGSSGIRFGSEPILMTR